MAAAGAALTGFGYSLVYPGLGVEAVRRAPPQSRGLAMGAYTVCLDVALGFGSPALGLAAGRFGLDAAFLISALVALGSAIVALRLLFGAGLKRPSRDSAVPLRPARTPPTIAAGSGTTGDSRKTAGTSR